MVGTLRFAHPTNENFRHCEERSDEAIHSFFAERWIASQSLSSGAHSRDPLARNDVDYDAATFRGRSTRSITNPS